MTKIPKRLHKEIPNEDSQFISMYKSLEDGKIYYKDANGQIISILDSKNSGSGSGGSLTYFLESQNTTAPNTSINANALNSVATTTNADFTIVPKGTGAFQLAIPNNLTSGGNKRGLYAVDLQLFRTVNSQIASGNYSFIGGGKGNRSSNDSSFTLGAWNVANGLASGSIGLGNYSEQKGDIAIGTFNLAGAKKVDFYNVGGVYYNASLKTMYVTGDVTAYSTLGSTIVWMHSNNYALYTSVVVSSTYNGSTYTSIVITEDPSGGVNDTFLYDYGFLITEKSTDAYPSGRLAQGSINIAWGRRSHAEGYYTQAIGRTAHSEGHQTIATGVGSHTEGFNTATNGQGSHAEGYLSTSNGNYSHAEGQSTISSGVGSHAEGLSTTSSGNYSHAEGYNNTSSGLYSKASGQSSTASGTNAMVHGNASGAYANSAIVLGDRSTANAINTFVTGDGANTFSVINRRVHGNGYYTTSGDSQCSKFLLKARTTDAASTALTTNAAVVSTNNQIVAQINQAVSFKGRIIGKQSGVTNVGIWDIEGTIVRSSVGSDSFIGTPTVTTISNLNGWGNPTISLNIGVQISVQGLAGTNIQWLANIDTTEVLY